VATIAITGASGFIGRRLVAALERRGDVDRIVGIDRLAPQGSTSRKLVFRQGDVCDGDLAEAFRGVDVVIHLAFRDDPAHDEAAMRRVNVDGTINVFAAAHAAEVPRVIYTSSVTAYGAHPDNDLPLTEDSPIRGTPGLTSAEHERQIEAWLWPWLADHAGVDVAVLRLAAVLGPGLQNALSRMLESPRLTIVKGHKPPLQFVHLDDAVGAIVHVLDHGLTGAYNVCAEGWLSFDEVTAIASKRTLELPEEVAFSAAERLWKMGVGEQPPGLVRHLMYPWVMSADRLIATGWRPERSNRDALAETVGEHAGYVAVAGVRAQRSAIRGTLSALAGVVGFVVLRSWRRRRRRRSDVVGGA